MADSSTSSTPSRLDRSDTTFVGVSMVRAQLLGGVLSVVLLAIPLGAHLSLWGMPSDPEAIGTATFPLFFGALVLGIVVHEGLHGLGFWWGGADGSAIEFGFSWEGLAPYAHCDAPLRCAPYRWAVLLPGLVLGGGPLVVGLGVGHWGITGFGAVMLAVAGGDLLILWLLRTVPRRAWVHDHPSQVGALVLGLPAAEEAPELTFDLEDEEQDGQTNST